MTPNLTIELEPWMAAAIAAKAEDLGCSEPELVIKGIKLILGLDHGSLSQLVEQLVEKNIEQLLPTLINHRLDQLESRLESQISDRLANSSSSISSPTPTTLEIKSEIKPTIRQIQVGDTVQIRDQTSPYYLEILTVTKVGMLMAHVATANGEQNFLKRDLRFVQENP